MVVWIPVVLIFLLSIAFTWTNGFQHASAVSANAIGSHSLNKKQVIALIFVFEFFGTIFGGSKVADVIESLSAWPKEPSLLPLIASALAAAILWNMISRRINIPSSSTHALIGGMIGALFVGDWSFEYVKIGSFDPVHPSGVIGALISLFLSPMLGFMFAFCLFCMVLIACLRASSAIEGKFRNLQWLLTAVLAFGDGQNDTQKTMGLLVLTLNAAGFMDKNEIPIWVRIMIGLAMAIGAFSLSPGVVKELAYRVYKLKPLHACVADASAATILLANSAIGGPVSASQVIAGAIMGTGAAESRKGIHWLVIKNIVLSWLVTIPSAALLAALVHSLLFRWFQAGVA